MKHETLNAFAADNFMKEHKGEGYNYFIRNTYKQSFIKFDDQCYCLECKNYILKSNEQVISLKDVLKQNLDILEVDLTLEPTKEDTENNCSISC